MQPGEGHQRRAAFSVEKRSESNIGVFQLIIMGMCMIAATQLTSLVRVMEVTFDVFNIPVAVELVR